MLARRIDPNGTIFTWVGVYSALDKTISGREGAYFGAGMMFWNTVLPGKFLYDVSKAAAGSLADIFRRDIGNHAVADAYVEAARRIFDRIQAADLGLPTDFPDLFARTEQPLQRDVGLGSNPDRGRRGFLMLPDESKSFPEGIDLFQLEPAAELQKFNRAILTKHPRLAETLRGNRCEEIGRSTATDATSHIAEANSGSEPAFSVSDKEVYGATPMQVGRSVSDQSGASVERSAEYRIQTLEKALQRLTERVSRLETGVIEEPPQYSSTHRTRAHADPPPGHERQSMIGSLLAEFASHLSLSIFAWLFSCLLIAVACIAIIIIKLPQIEAYFELAPQIPSPSTENEAPSATLPPTTARTAPPNQTPAVPSNPEEQIDVADVKQLLNNIQGFIPNRGLSALLTVDEAEVWALASSETSTAAKARIEKDEKLHNAYLQFANTPVLEQFITLLEIDHCLEALITAPQTKLLDAQAYCPSPVNLKE